MTRYTKPQLEAAHKALSSSRRKIEHVRETLLKKQPIPKSQLTLSTRNLAALELALALIEREMTHTPPQGGSED